MKKYFFYSAGGQGIIFLQFPNAADSFGVAKNPIVYKIKLTASTTLSTVNEGDLITETALMTALEAAFSDVKVLVEDPNSNYVFLLVDEES